MNEQTIYALKKALVLVGIAALGVVSDQLVTGGFELTPTYAIIATSAVAAALRILEGIRDGQRAHEGIVIPADVGFSTIEERVLHRTLADGAVKVAPPA